MLIDVFPLIGLRLRTPLVELRYPTDETLAELGELAARGVHDPSVQPFAVEWTDRPVEDIPRAVLQYQWSNRAALSAERWSLELAVFRDGQLVGIQGISAQKFAQLREVHTGSWLGQAFQRQGIGTHMRAAVLQLAFDGLGAVAANSEAFTDNPASTAVSLKLGYQRNGSDHLVIRGERAESQRLRLSRADWEAHRSIPVEIDGLEPCLAMLGAA
jgi:RimJ/RimL family protein N-acetyltransferase